MVVLSKGEFAAHIGVSPGRISQYLDAGIIGPECLVGQGRFARIDADRAKQQISARRDIGQSLGNGLATRLDLDAPALPAASETPATPRAPSIEDEIKAQRLESERRKNRVAAVEEATQLGQLVPVGDMRKQLRALAAAMDEEAGGMLADFATALAAEFHLVQRDVLHLLKRVRAEKKAGVAARARQRADALPETVEAVIEGIAA